MKRIRPIMFFFLGLATNALLCGCNNNVDGPESGQESTKTGPRQTKTVYLYLDNSESMAGYTKSTNMSVFVEAINAIGGYYKSQGADIGSYYLQSKTVKGVKKTDIEPVGFDALCSQISNRKLPKTDSYAIDSFFAQITQKMLSDSNKSAIAFFITDGIISGTNEEINGSTDRRFSLDNASTLSERVADALRPLHDKGYGAAMYRFTSGFKGDYLAYDNKRIELHNAKRPFYIIVIGESSEVAEFNKKVEDGLGTFKPDESLLIDQPKPLLLLGTEVNNEVDSDLVVINYQPHSKESKETEVEIYFQKKCLPGHLRDDSTAAEALDITFNSKPITPRTRGEIISFDISARKNEKNQTLNIKVKDILPTWVNTYNSDNDKRISDNNQDELSKTFKLSSLVKGIMKGLYNSDGSEIITARTFKIDNTNNK